jgi:ankyrin repeat protein
MKLCPGCGEGKPLGHFNKSSKTADGKAPRCRACVNRRRRAATRRVATGATTRPKAPLSPQAAATRGDLEALRAAVARESPTDLNRLLGTVLAWATEPKTPRYVDAATYLMDLGADPNARAALGMPMVCLAARSGVAALVDAIRRRGFDATFYTAAALGEIDAVRAELQDRPQAARTPDENDMSPLLYCAQSALGREDEHVERRLAEIASLLLEHGAAMDAAPESPESPLSVAAGHSGNLPLVAVLLERTPGRPDEGPLWDALRSMRKQGDRYSRVCDLLHAHGEYELDHMLLGNARHEDVQATTWLLAHGADPSLRLEDGRTTLHLAADRNSGVRVIKLLLDSGADMDALDDLGHTPLHYARQSEKARIVEFLRSRGARE